VAEMRGKRVMAVSAIGNPASFEQTLSNIGAVVIESLRFPDHHDYTVQEMLDVAAQALLLDAEAIVITEKDAVKVPVELLRERADFKIPIYVVSVEVMFRDGEEEFIRLMKENMKEKLHK
ncbi:MAG: tetraacyldisaccharide 4'-kinase, partial [Schwartzia sp.]|nr:tetraacyldisaccharide 4'-kinase [Schwartzia sp. (in: firmicutes)]